MSRFALNTVVGTALILFAIAPALAGTGIAVVHVPEPSSMGLFAAGAVAVVYLRKRLRK